MVGAGPADADPGAGGHRPRAGVGVHAADQVAGGADAFVDLLGDGGEELVLQDAALLAAEQGVLLLDAFGDQAREGREGVAPGLVVDVDDDEAAGVGLVVHLVAVGGGGEGVGEHPQRLGHAGARGLEGGLGDGCGADGRGEGVQGVGRARWRVRGG